MLGKIPPHLEYQLRCLVKSAFKPKDQPLAANDSPPTKIEIGNASLIINITTAFTSFVGGLFSLLIFLFLPLLREYSHLKYFFLLLFGIFVIYGSRKINAALSHYKEMINFSKQ